VCAVSFYPASLPILFRHVYYPSRRVVKSRPLPLVSPPNNNPTPSPHHNTRHLKQPQQLFNPPYVPTPDEEVERDGIARAWAGGHRGRRVIDRLLPHLGGLLAPGGHCFMVTVLENEPEDIIRQLAAQGISGNGSFGLRLLAGVCV